MSKPTTDPKRPIYREAAPTNRRIYFGAVNGIRSIPGVLGDLVAGSLGTAARYIGLILLAGILVWGYHEMKSAPADASTSTQAETGAKTPTHR
ncbi:hypothetical protein AB4Y45_35405 [Paraburkholderia sp. EG287A]|uniref:hypothetical protein n=1 Tax=Paraburkholderia sp. EG287A TaxID=3237012 RepID=UPI0034D210B7